MAKVIQDVGEQPLVLHSDVREPLAQMSFLQRSLVFAELSMVSYNDEAEARRAAEAIGFEEAELFDNDGSQAYRFRNEHDCVVTCRGTEPNEWNDLKADANASMALLETIGKVHSGFNREVDDLWPLVEEVLRGSDRPVWFCGHSLGGAMATICAYRCKKSSLTANPRELHTFGSPRVGNGRYIRHAALEHYRWVNNNDLVTRVPPPWMGYRHGGDEIYLDRNGHIRRLTGLLRSRDRWRGFLKGLARGQIDPLADHSIHLYAEHILNAAREEARGVARGKGEVDEDDIVIRNADSEPTA
jgi:triacylglycerol lipase